MELIVNAAIQSSLSFIFAREAQIGIVPYIHKGDAMPRSEAGIMPKTPNFVLPRAATALFIFSFAKTDITDPMTIPKIQ